MCLGCALLLFKEFWLLIKKFQYLINYHLAPSCTVVNMKGTMTILPTLNNVHQWFMEHENLMDIFFLSFLLFFQWVALYDIGGIESMTLPSKRYLWGEKFPFDPKTTGAFFFYYVSLFTRQDTIHYNEVENAVWRIKATRTCLMVFTTLVFTHFPRSWETSINCQLIEPSQLTSIPSLWFIRY